MSHHRVPSGLQFYENYTLATWVDGINLKIVSLKRGGFTLQSYAQFIEKFRLRAEMSRLKHQKPENFAIFSESFVF